MSADPAQLVMALAIRCLPNDSEWGHAMQAEFNAARLEGCPLAFAIGCLWTGWQRLPLHNKGRFILAGHALALGLLVPIATFHLGCAISAARFLLTGRDPYYGMLIAQGDAGRALANAYQAATPALMVLLLLLGTVHLSLAWSVLDGRWRRVSLLWMTGATIAAAIVCIIAVTAPSVFGSAVQLAALALELATVPPLAAWHRTHFPIAHDMEV
jgi:hypothetical protein